MELRPEIRRASRRVGLALALMAGSIGIVGLGEVSADSQNSTPTITAGKLGPLAVTGYSPAKQKQLLKEMDTTTTAPPPLTTQPPLTPAEWAAQQVTPLDIAQWTRVHNCEEPTQGWHVNGSKYGGGLGISRANWAAYGGLRQFGDEAAATEDEQIVVGKRIQHNPPDQHGCQPGGW